MIFPFKPLDWTVPKYDQLPLLALSGLIFGPDQVCCACHKGSLVIKLQYQNQYQCNYSTLWY